MGKANHENMIQTQTVNASWKGFSLIEMMVALAVGSAMAGIGVSVLYLLLALERDSRSGLRHRASLAHLIERFRDDVHRATEFDAVATPNGEGDAQTAWELKLAEDHTIRYVYTEGQLRRTERAEGELVGQDAFVLPEHVEVSVEISDDRARPIVTLRIVPGDLPVEKPAVRPVRVDAVLGSDHRFLETEEL